MNKVSIIKRFLAYVLVDACGNAVEITDSMCMSLRQHYRHKHYYLNTVEDNRFEITDITDDENEEVIFLSEPDETENRLHEKISRAFSIDNTGLNFYSVSNLAEVAMKVTNLHIVFLSEEY